MTAVAAFALPDAAYLASDTAIWGPDGRVQSFETKVISLSAIRTAIVATGVLQRGLLKVMAEEARDLIDLQAIIAEYLSENPARIAADPRWRPMAAQAEKVAIRGASWINGAAVLWTIDPEFGDLDVRHLGAAWWAPDVDMVQAAGREVTSREDVYALDPSAIVGRMMDEQRKVTLDLGFGPIHVCGGACRMATITAAGVKVTTLKRWPNDRIGERIIQP